MILFICLLIMLAFMISIENLGEESLGVILFSAFIYGILSIPAYLILEYNTKYEKNPTFTYNPIYKDSTNINKVYVYDIENEVFIEGKYHDEIINSDISTDIVNVYKIKIGKIMWFFYPIASYRYENDYVYILEKNGIDEKIHNDKYFPKDSIIINKKTLILD